MALYGGLDRTKHFEEFASPLNSAQGTLTPAQRRALALANLSGATLTAAQLAVLGSVTPGTAAASKALVLDSDGEIDVVKTNRLFPADVVGTVTTGATTVAEEHGDDVFHITKLTLTAFAMGNSGDNASLAIGNKFYTFPAGTILVEDCTIVGGITAAVSNTAQTPEVGIGTVIGSGANATLSTTTEDIVDGGAAGGVGGDTVAPDVAGTAFYKSNTFTTGVLIKTSGGKTHDMFLNAAVAWADVTAAGAVVFTGVITFKWRVIS